jgi:hypothetical protein
MWAHSRAESKNNSMLLPLFEQGSNNLPNQAEDPRDWVLRF